MTHTTDATKTITRAVPTVNEDGLVIKWNIEVKYEFNDYVSTFHKSVDVEPVATSAEYTKAELWALANESHLDTVYESQYESVKLAPADTTETISDFKVEDLA